MKFHEFEICRSLYAEARRNGSPPVGITDLGGFVIAETKDGKIRNEGVSECCKWGMKYECALRWVEKFKPIQQSKC